MREVVAEAKKPVMRYSVGKDSSVMLEMPRRAFHPAEAPSPLLHMDTLWKFKDMYEFRDRMAAESGMALIVHVNPEGREMNINPCDYGSEIHTHVMKTVALKQPLDEYGFDGRSAVRAGTGEVPSEGADLLGPHVATEDDIYALRKERKGGARRAAAGFRLPVPSRGNTCAPALPPSADGVTGSDEPAIVDRR